MGQYDTIRAHGIALIKKKGRAVKILVGGDNAPVDPTKPWNVTKAAPTEYPCIAVVLDFVSKRLQSGLTDKICYVPGDFGLFEIDQSMRVKVLAVTGSTVPDRTYSIASVTVYEPDGIPIGWKLRLELWPQTSLPQPTRF